MLRVWIKIILLSTLFAGDFLAGVLAQQHFNFNDLGIEDGLSNSPVTAIVEDTSGYIWMGTLDGLNKYNGYDFKIYRHDNTDSTSLSDNAIEDLTIDKNGHLWIATYKGLNRYREEFDDFITYLPDSSSAGSLKSNGVNDLYVDSKSKLWISTWSGLHQFDYSSNQFIYYPLKNDSITNGELSTTVIVEYKDHYLVGTPHSGLFRFYPSKNLFSPLKAINNRNIHITDIEKDKNNRLWISTKENGMFLLKDSTLKHFTSRNGLPENNINDLFLDKDNQLFIGFKNEGVRIYNILKNTFSELNINGSLTEDHSFFNSVHLITRTRNGCLWIGSSFGGVHYQAPSASFFKKYDSKYRTIPGLRDKNINCIEQTSDSAIWLGTTFAGIQEFNMYTGHYKYIDRHSHYFEGLNENSIKCLVNHNNKVLIGTNRSVYIADKNTHQIKQLDIQFRNKQKLKNINFLAVDPNRESALWICSGGLVALINLTDNSIIYESGRIDKYGTNFIFVLNLPDSTIMISSQMGVHKLNKDFEFIKTYTLGNKTRYFESQRISKLFMSSGNELYLGAAKGLMKYDSISDQFHIHPVTNKLNSPYIYSIEEDQKGKLWLSTSGGLSAYDPFSDDLRTFTVEDGLQSNMFITRSSQCFKDGKMAFGGINGFNIFNPADIKLKSQSPKIYITKFQLFNRTLHPKSSNLLNKSIHLTDQIRLKHHQHSFTINFEGITYGGAANNQYKYRLAGFSDKWSKKSPRRSATYTNIPPGNYIFEVISSNNEGIWNQSPARLKLIITPPFYQRVWFRVLLVIIFLGISLLILRAKTAIYRVNQRKLEKEVEARTKEIQLQNEKITELNSQRLRFFTNISHEIRTPLQLITGPVERIKKLAGEDHEIQKYAGFIEKSSQRLLKLINQLLDFRKIEHEHFQAHNEVLNLRELFEPIVENFRLLASNEEKTFEINNLEFLNQEFVSDKDKIEKITYNLLSNAFKYCGKPGYIKMDVAFHNNYLHIQIENDGKGISRNQKKLIFERFAQLNNTYEWKPGSGVGLEYTKKLIESLNGEISFHSDENDVTSFYVGIPPQNLSKENQSSRSDCYPIHFEAIRPEVRKDISVLLIEDDTDVNEYLTGILSDYYTILSEYDGQQGLDRIKEEKPNMVISDILLPGIDGIQLCKTVKTSPDLNQIPVLLLTSLKEPEYVAEGTFAGADGYIYKPFPEDLLLAKVHTILKNNSILKDKYQKTISLTPTIDQDTDEKEAFLRKTLSLIEEKMHLPEFGAGDLARDLNLSRGTLYNRIREYTNQPVKELINDTRLEKARQLLKQNQTTVIEVAYHVGFNDPKHFSRLFKKRYGESPSQYKSANKN